ncbi:hypothetical protein [Novosphingobium sp. 9]|uniref:hypothetical protein n=1 Tax=Novosphingobium sp. 9 TaxID=2025349 RepID=UPI0021B56CBB|nr:hypothetical protein [Novosphingobium sp. 9]
MGIAGTYDFAVATPMGEQKGTLSVVPDATGASFTGKVAGALGALSITGTVSGDTLEWTMKTPVPIPLEIECSATISGDTLSGTAKAGFMGSYPMTGTRTG